VVADGEWNVRLKKRKFRVVVVGKMNGRGRGDWTWFLFFTPAPTDLSGLSASCRYQPGLKPSGESIWASFSGQPLQRRGHAGGLSLAPIAASLWTDLTSLKLT
jgi:hypothetical protein